MKEISRAEAKRLLADSAGSRVVLLSWHYEDGWKRVGISPELLEWRTVERVLSNGVVFTGGSRLSFDGAQCRSEGNLLQVFFDKTRLTYELKEG